VQPRREGEGRAAAHFCNFGERGRGMSERGV
jgi:hypothetical protein